MRSAAVAAILVTSLACSHGNNDTPDSAQIDSAQLDSAQIDAPNIDAQPIDASLDAIDAMPTPSELIGFARATADGTGLTLPIQDATITYVRTTAIGNDPAGFTIQVAQQGPALLVAVDPTSLAPTPTAGDTVSFTINTMATVSAQRRATLVSNYTRSATGANVHALAQDISNTADIVSAIDNYDSELIDVTGTVAGTFASSGAMFQAAAVNTTGLMNNTSYLLRMPTTVHDALDAAMGCAFTITDTPVNRFNTQAELQIYGSAEIQLTACPAPTVVTAVAISGTQVRVDFTRNILASSVMANGSQFTFDNGLTASAATVSGRSVTLTTDLQAGGTNYLLTVANTVTDLAGTAVGTPNTFTFAGFVTLAVVRINEVNANITGGCDLIELRVVSGGSMTGYKLQERTGVNAGTTVELAFVFPAFNVLTNDFIVLHTNMASATCNPGSGTAETTAKNQQPMSTFTHNFDSAYDFYSTDDGLTATDNVITLYDATNTIIDAALFTDDVNGTAAANSETQAAAVAAVNQWHMPGGGIPPAGPLGVPPAGFVDDNFCHYAALDLNGTGTITGTSIQRLDNTDDNDVEDWNSTRGTMLDTVPTTTVQQNTWGALNPGQTDF